ncbi:spermidine synthase [Agromyces terreus]|uniref:Spermidine synthase n=1 Tax=Agromyces terreus TaxID=424795 RepID=A0A9X2KFX4_9MICO|nr:fused MFS/spermidine synthase [Agromyces terreus]MCP2372237.1 spermidine synthase [Agromyces terreus]
MDDGRTLTLDAVGLHAELLPGRGANGGVSLVVDGVTQSHVNPADPLDLQLEYVRCVAALADGCLDPAQPVRVLHLGAGALTIARYLGATRRDGVHHVVDLHRELVEFVLDALPLDPSIVATFEYDDARAALARAAQHGIEYDLVIVDLFSGSRTPEHLSTLGFFELTADVLSPGGVMAVNAIAEPGLAAVRATGATLRDVFDEVVALAAPAVLADAGRGNVVFGAAHRPLAQRPIRRRADPAHRRIDVLGGAALSALLDGAAVRRD